MVRRGQCDNPTKVRNVQSIGGAVALIADYQEESLDNLVMEQTSRMSLTIPGYMVDHDVANIIYKQLNTTAVYLRSELTINNTDDQL